jgi:hypothetical protein
MDLLRILGFLIEIQRGENGGSFKKIENGVLGN